MGTFQNISPETFRKFLEYKGLKYLRTKGDHEMWSKQDMLRPVVFQIAVNPVPEFILKNNLRIMGSTRKELTEFASKSRNH